MKIQKILILLICMLVCACTVTSFAADFTADERGIVNFSDNFDVSELSKYKDYGSYRFTYGDYDKYLNYIVTDKNDNIQNFGQVILDNTGKVNFSFRIKGETGEYKITLTNVKLGSKTYTIDYVNNIYIDFNTIKNDSDFESMIDFLNESGKLFDFDSKAFSLLDDVQKDKIVNNLLIADDVESIDDLKELLDNEKVVDVLFETTETPQILTEYILSNAENEHTVFNKNIVDVFDTELSDTEKNSILSDIMGYPLDKKAVDKFEFQVLKSRVHQIKYFSDMDLIIFSDGNIWGFDSTDINKYKKCNIDAVQKAMLIAVDDVNTLNEYRKKFASLVAANPKDNSGGGSGTSKGSKNSGVVVSGGKTQNYEINGNDFLTPNSTVKQEFEPSSAKTIDFKDLGGFEWATDAIKVLVNNYIINGISDTEFQPSRTIKREEFVKLITSGLRLTGAEAEVEFSDVNKDDWFYDVVGAARRAEIISGDENGCFGSGREITRQDAAVILARTAAYKGVTLKDKNDFAFTDSDLIASYAKSGVEKLARAGIINGMEDGSFAPEASLTRAEAAVMLYKFFLELSVIK